MDKPNEVLYKYRDWDKGFHKLLLNENQIYIPLVKELNDPFDYQFNLEGDLIQTESDRIHLIELMCKSSEEFIKDPNTLKQKKEERIKLLGLGI